MRMRFIMAAVAASSIAMLLFLLMNSLISGEQGFDREALGSEIVDFVRVQPDEIVREKERERREDPPPPEEPPALPPIEIADRTKPAPSPLDIEMPNPVSFASVGSGPTLQPWGGGDATNDSDVVPIVRIAPQYPRAALIDRVEGWVRIRFLIEPDGSVSGPVVIDAEPRGVFERAARTAILNWKFRPQIVDGQAVARRAEQIIDFTLSD